MRPFGISVAMAGLLALCAGCSEQTVEKSKVAAEATGEAIESAVEDAAVNVKEGAQAVEDSLKANDEPNPPE